MFPNPEKHRILDVVDLAFIFMICTLKVNIDVPSNTRGESVFKFGTAGYYLGIFCGEVLGFLFFLFLWEGLVFLCLYQNLSF